MSSLIGHVSAGVTLYLCQGRLDEPRARWAVPLFVLLAICPDFDYLAAWLLHVGAAVRFTHSLFFCVGIGLLAWLLLRLRNTAQTKSLGPIALVLAACSHLALDLAVGVHPLPILWPLPAGELQSPLGLLPSAGHLYMTNYLLWRNLLIECGVLWPLFGLLVAIRRSIPLSALRKPIILLGPLWLVFLAWSIRIHR